MGLLDRFFRKRGPEPLDPDTLREKLFDAVAAGDRARCAELCGAYEAQILANFGVWAVIPVEIRKDRQAVNRWAQGLIAVAQLFEERGHPELIERLSGPPAKNPLTVWEERLREARKLVAEGDLLKAIPILRACIEENRELIGTGSDRYMAITHGGLGQNLFHSGSPEQAVPHLTEALRLCEASEDPEDRSAVTLYLRNLYEVRRYLGDVAGAALLAERLSSTAATEPERKKWQERALRVRRGEPKNRVVAVIGEEIFELEDLPHIESSRVRFQFERDRVPLTLAEDYIALGSQRASEGEYEEALECFERAAQVDPFHPQAAYLRGLTLLHLHRYEEAVQGYVRTEELAPGWFHCRADLALARALVAGRITHETFLDIERLDGEKADADLLRRAEEALLREPGLPVLHLLHGRVLAAMGRESEADDAFRRGLGLLGDDDVRTRLLVERAGRTRDPLERAQLLEEVLRLSDTGNLIAVAMARAMLRANTPA